MTTEGTTPDQPLAEDVQPAEPAAPEERLAPAAAPLAPAPVQPEAEQGVSDGTLICTVCKGIVGRGEKYVTTSVRGVNHLDPCSHRS